ncbi:bacteriohemerythrin [Noviherbaspirillum aridicola]|uniref:Hemerythrin-like domain-containing protein n=1 Tax=Noviherbaspirillum aridicola TaxID=2849687 RepID=A0ABQ4Q006_9BURK|nr:hemerythrin family protein [Noviherbaspirillum aridicola]GIZ50475.1 hypothetical protein NCCP691_04890 [Noviherbaspirillum aridicola]
MATAANLPPDDVSHGLDASPVEFGVAAMDLAHRNLLNELSQLRDVCDQEFVRCYPALVAAVERDFREEENLMETLGLSSFRAHLEQHARMLAALHCTMSGACGGDTAPARAAVGLLREWMEFHIPSMDRELAAAMQARSAPGATMQ